MTAIVISFDTPWIAAASPIVLSFTDEPTPEIPEVPISPGTIGLMCGIGIAVGPSVAQLLSIESATKSHATQIRPQWQVGHVAQMVTAAWQAKALMGITASVVWRWNQLVPCNVDVLWLVPDLHAVQATSLWLSPESVQTSVAMPWRQPAATAQIIALGLLQGELVATEVKLAHSNIGAAGDMKGIAWGPHAARWVCSNKYRPPKGKITINFSDPWVDAASPIVINFTASPNICYWDDGGGLIGTNPSLPNIDFKIPIEPQIRRYYLMQPTLSCVRVADGQVIVITSVGINDARGQFTQGVSIEFGSAIDASRAHNQLLLITINGYDFFAIAEQINKSSSFGTASFSANGRSKTALLASPWKSAVSYTNSVAKSFAGLLSDILINSGWTVGLVGIPDFMVPAGAYSAIADSPLDLLNDAVSQLNCMMIADEANQVIKVYPRWPTVPWAAGSTVADVNIHDAVIMTYSGQEEVNQACDVVWLRGEQKGISASVKRQGSAGTTPAGDIVASLIVDVQAARVAGSMALADTGNKEMVSVTLPIMNDLPPLRKGMLIGVTYQGEVYKAICDQVSVSATVDPNGGIDIYQSVKLIRHI